jgi:hypothetical protein
MRRLLFGSGTGPVAGDRVYIVPMICYNRQVIWQGEEMLPSPLLFQPIRYVNNSYVNAVFDGVGKKLETEDGNGNE